MVSIPPYRDFPIANVTDTNRARNSSKKLPRLFGLLHHRGIVKKLCIACQPKFKGDDASSLRRLSHATISTKPQLQRSIE